VAVQNAPTSLNCFSMAAITCLSSPSRLAIRSSSAAFLRRISSISSRRRFSSAIRSARNPFHQSHAGLHVATSHCKKRLILLTVFKTLALSLLLSSAFLLTLSSRLLEPLVLEFLHDNGSSDTGRVTAMDLGSYAQSPPLGQRVGCHCRMQTKRREKDMEPSIRL